MYEDEEKGWVMIWCVFQSNNLLNVSFRLGNFNYKKKIKKEKKKKQSKMIRFLYIYQISWLEKDLEVGTEKKLTFTCRTNHLLCRRIKSNESIQTRAHQILMDVGFLLFMLPFYCLCFHIDTNTACSHTHIIDSSAYCHFYFSLNVCRHVQMNNNLLVKGYIVSQTNQIRLFGELHSIAR